MNTPFTPGCPWYSWYETFGPSNVKWCEERVCTWFNEPANTWSNLVFILVAAVIYFQSTKAKKPLGKGFALAVFFLGSFSFVYHASNNYLTQILDFIGMYFYVYLLLVLNLFRLGSVSEKKVVPTFLGLVVVSTLLIPLAKAVDLPYQLVVVLAGVAILYTEVLAQKRLSVPRKTKFLLWASLVTFIGAEFFSYIDLKRIYCDPTNHLLQGHAILHLFNALGIYLSFLYYQNFMSVKNTTD